VDEYTLLVGTFDQDQSFAALVGQVAAVTGASIWSVPGEDRSVVGEFDLGRLWVYFESADSEPFASHPYVIDIKLNDASRELEVAGAIYEGLVTSGDYRVILLEDSGLIRSSHFPSEEWQ
jgi:hypothetical protein